MKLFCLIVALCLAAIPSCASSGGSQAVDVTSGYSFRDIIGSNYNANYGWNSRQMGQPSRAVFMGGSQPSRYPMSTVQWTIQDGDDPLNNGSNRNEVANMFGATQQDESLASGTQYYGISVYIPDTWVAPSGAGNWFIVLQLHGNDTNTGHSGQATFQFLLSSGLNTAGHYSIRTVGGLITGAGTIAAQNDVVTDLGALVYNGWVDFIFKVTWAIDNTGQVTVYKRIVGTDATLVQIATYSAPNLYTTDGITAQAQAYWKRGIYRGPPGVQGTDVIYVSPLTRSTIMQNAAFGSFGQWP